MRARTTAVLCGVLVSVAACDLGNVTAVPRDAGLEVTGAPLRSAGSCPEIRAATYWPQNPDPAAIAQSCSAEAGCANDQSPIGLSFEFDRTFYNPVPPHTGPLLAVTRHDWVRIRCSNGTETGIGSDDACWDCVNGCAGSACEGEYCTAIPDRQGSDCLAFSCPAGYRIERGPGDYGKEMPMPYCRLYDRSVAGCDDPTISIDGADRVRPGGQCTWTAVSQAPPGSTVTWYNDGRWQGTGESYTGGRQDGSISTHFRIRADITTPAGRSSSAEILVREDPRAHFCPT